MRRILIVLVLMASHHVNSKCQFYENQNLLMNIEDYPTIFELNLGEQFQYKRLINDQVIEYEIKLIKIKPNYSSYFWNLDDGNHGKDSIFHSAKISLEINGQLVEIDHRPFEFPVTLGGIRLYIEAVKEWAIGGDLADLKRMEKDARFSICLAKETWGSKNIKYPIANYKFKSSSYNNTWGSLVPYAPLYYHKGEDMGAIPDRFPVSSPISGEIIGWPGSKGDGLSNGIIIKDINGIVFRLAHMNAEHIRNDLKIGDFINSGDFLGFTGSTWLGGRNQTHDPHFHVEMWYINKTDTIHISPYPYLVEAYFRMYSDPVLAIAGNYEWTTPGELVYLDGNRSIVRSGEKIKSYKWILHNDSIVNEAQTSIRFTQPGLYTQELVVETHNGEIDRDFVQVRVWDSSKTFDNIRDIAFGWVYHYPVRNVKIGDPVLFWNRIHNTMKSVFIDFGDGTPPVKFYNSIAHPYLAEGSYVVRIWGYGPRNEPFIYKLEVVVE